MIQKYGICICHGRNNPINSKGLCPIGAKKRHERSAASKGMLTKSARNNENLAINETEDGNEKDFNHASGNFCGNGKETAKRHIGNLRKWDGRKPHLDEPRLAFNILDGWEESDKSGGNSDVSRNKSISKTKSTFKKTRIQPRSEKNKKLVAQEFLMFKQIWKERPHFCEVSGKPLGAFDVRMFSHVLCKGNHPKFRLYKKNIVLCLPDKHFEWEFSTRKTLELSWIETLESALKTEYYLK